MSIPSSQGRPGPGRRAAVRLDLGMLSSPGDPI